jgi:hypothetical protein
VPVPDKSDLESFLRIDGWTETQRGDPYRYRKQLDNGDILRTKVSFGRGPAFDDPGLWRHVWKDQLGLSSEDEFWETLKTRTSPQRGQAIPTPAPSGPTKPAWLYEFLVNVAHMESEEALALSEEEAMKIYMQRVQAQARGR